METGYEMSETEMAEALTDLDNTADEIADLYSEAYALDRDIMTGVAASEDFDRFETVCAMLRAMGV